MNNLKIAVFISIIFALVSEDIQGKNPDNSNRSNIVPGVVVAKLRSIDQNIDIANSIALQQHSILKIERAFPRHDFSPALSRLVNIRFSNSTPPEEFASQLFQTGIFEYVEPKFMSYISDVIPNDKFVAQQFYLDQVNMFSAWEVETGSKHIVIAIVDNGTDYRHPDLWDNIWRNLPEVNGTPGIDDDGNGFVDDFHGWDFGDNDNNPTYGTDEARTTVHGTHTAGIASAVTDNMMGIAGVGWNCSIMPIKTSRDDDARSIPFGYEGIVYAADNGAHVINNSWGRGGLYSQFEQDIINYATSKGSIVVAAAGNTRANELFFPAAYVNVVAVAAVNDVDRKTSYSTYGKFVDLSAPGGESTKGILSTFPVSRGSYGELAGTSFASPIVAGIMGLLINRFPDFSQFELIRQIVLTTDQIDDINPAFAGLLGNGRANAFQALTLDQNQLTEQPAKIGFVRAAVSDSVWGNGNFLFERNEVIGVDVWYRNFAVSPGYDLTITLTTDDPDLAIKGRKAVIPYVPPDSIFTIEKQLSFKISPEAKAHVAKLALNYSLPNAIGGVDTIIAMIGKSSVLLVDDDNSTRNVEGYYITALEHLNIPHLRWDHVQLGSPPASILAQFPMIIWFCEWAFPSLTPDDRTALQSYLNQGGSLFISGQDIGWDLADPTGVEDNQYSESAVKFYQEVLHSIYRADISGSSKVIGIPGTVVQGLSFDIYQPKISLKYQFPEWIEAAPDAQLIFKYENEKGSGVFFQGDYSVLNLGFGFEAIDATFDEDPKRNSKMRLEVMSRVMDKLGPIRHQPIADSALPVDSILFRAEISPLVNDLISLTLFWKTENMTDYSEIEMNAFDARIYQQTIRLSSFPCQVDYYFKMVTPQFDFCHPVAAPAKPYAITIGVDQAAPQIYHVPLYDIFIQNTGRLIRVFVEDNIAVDRNSVSLHYAAGAARDSINMSPVADNWYEAFLPPIIRLGDSVQYYFSASDLAPVANRAVSPVFSYKIGVEGFEFGLDYWITDSLGWHIDANDPHSGSYCISTSPGKSYPRDQNISIQTKFGLPRRDLQDAMLRLWMRYEIEASKDYGFIEVSLDHGATWMGVANPVTGIQQSWVREICDLSAFYAESNDTLLLRFRLFTDTTQTQSRPGWFIDDIAIQSAGAVSVADNESFFQTGAPVLANVSNAPNPFNSITTIFYQINTVGTIDLEIFNMIGQQVFNKRLGIQQAGQHSIAWDGSDMAGRKSGSGLYFCRLTFSPNLSNPESNRMSKTIKMIYLQ